MGKGKKAFIDRKNAVKFQLVHRSQHDPLITDEKAPQHVLLEAGAHKKAPKEDEPTEKVEDHKKYRVRFDTEYEYLKKVEEEPKAIQTKSDDVVEPSVKLCLPSSVFASEMQEKDGILNKAAQQTGFQPDWDPDVVAALDDDFDFDNEDNLIEDDFVIKAMDQSPPKEKRKGKTNGQNYSDSTGSLGNSGYRNPFRDESFYEDSYAESHEEETKSRFTEYSMSSNVIRRNEKLSLLDEQFEQFYASYDDPELGDLQLEDIEGIWNQKHPYLLDCYKKFTKPEALEDNGPDNRKITRERLNLESDENSEEDLVESVVEDKRERWDCQSILSMTSNAYNHPKLIDETNRKRGARLANKGKIVIDPKSGFPVNVLRDSHGLSEKALTQLQSTDPKRLLNGNSAVEPSVISHLSVLSIRPKNETPEERRQRKKLLKNFRSDRRIEKKGNTQAFKEEQKRQASSAINQQINQREKKLV